MQDQGEVERRDGAERGSSRISDGVKRKFPAVAAILLAGTIMLGTAAGWQFARPVPAGPPTIEMIPSADVAEAMKTLSAEAIQQAHQNKVVHQLWAEYAEVCDYINLNSISEAANMFAEFASVD